MPCNMNSWAVRGGYSGAESLPVEEVQKRSSAWRTRRSSSQEGEGQYVYGSCRLSPGLFEFPFRGRKKPCSKSCPFCGQYKHGRQAEAFAGKPTPA